MDRLQTLLPTFYDRELRTVISEVEATAPEFLWSVPAGVTNSVGVLAQHIAGNLLHFIGAGVGGNGYVRDREREFTNTGRTREALIADLEQARTTAAAVFASVDSAALSAPYPYPLPATAAGLDTAGFLFHLYYHLVYHLGQLNHVRRINAG